MRKKEPFMVFITLWELLSENSSFNTAKGNVFS